uniref:DNA-directed RNA polymerase subunit beta n=1 Tax=Pseudellipsoidion edaphicum TaxID=1431838 RepID=A0A410D2T4_9STRA|nr:RNA polymerase subunit beta [Pseudellipsoidion edaphicum]QAA12013.1 RNA polymerase subunit beta [Pseudellipsoidion edaphicum]
MSKVFLPNLPDFVEIQKNSFCWFLKEGLTEELKQLNHVSDLMDTVEIKFFFAEFYFHLPYLTPHKAKKDKLNYSIRLYMPIEIEDKKIQTLEYHTLCLCDLPLMTERGTFIINGCERVILGQIVRSPGIYYKVDSANSYISNISATLISNRGSWLYFEYDKEKLIWIRTDRIDKIPIYILLENMGNQSHTLYSHLENSHYFDYVLRYAIKIYSKDSNFPYEDYKLTWENLKTEIFNPNYYSLGKVGRYKLNKKLGISLPNRVQTLTLHDLVEIIDYLIGLRILIGNIDDIDSLENRRMRSVGELLQSQFSQGCGRFSTFLEEKTSMMNTLDLTSFINPFPIQSSIDEFFVTNSLSQYLDQINPLAELMHKRRVTVLGPGGIPFEKTSLAIRDIHPSYYGRLCPIDTPEGEKAGLVASLSTFAQVSEQGFIKTPFFKVNNGRIFGITFLTVGEEEGKSIAMGDSVINSKGYLLTKKIGVKENDEFRLASPTEIDYLSISPFQFFSPAVGLIPFFEHDDANRTLMGAHMQRQAVPLLKPQKAIVGTGIESHMGIESGSLLLSYNKGIVRFVSSNTIWIKDIFGKTIIYGLEKFQSSNQLTLMNQRPIVWIGERVEEGSIIADGPSTDEGELSLGKNVTVAYMPWGGYNYEDAIVISERMVYENIFTSIHIEKLQIEVRDNDRGPDYLTRDLPEPKTESYRLRNLDKNGLVYVGVYVQPGDIIVGKLSPKRKDNAYYKLLEEVFGTTDSMSDTSLRVPLGMIGKTLEVCVFDKETMLDMPPKVFYIIQIFIANIRRIRVGDKMAGRHGNKGVISLISPLADLPFLPDGNTVDIILNPLGVPSRMNVGQLFECLLGLAGDKLDRRFKIFPFDEMYSSEASRTLVYEKLSEVNKKTNQKELVNFSSTGKVILKDGKTGDNFDNPITIGKPYILKLIHLVDDKIHARSIGPYVAVTQQPLRGRSREGGQRFGEMEVWALEAYGTAYTLQELLTLKSDDLKGRLGAYQAIIRQEQMPSAGIPESFRILMRELRALALDIHALRFISHSSGKLEPTVKTMNL